MREPSPAQREALVLAAEECAEVVQACMKILRFGYQNPWDHSLNPIERLESEIGDALAAFAVLEALGMIDLRSVEHYSRQKHQKLLADERRLPLASAALRAAHGR